MEAQLTIRDTLANFRDWVNSYGAARMGRRYRNGPSGWDPYTEESVYVLNHHAPLPAAYVLFHVRVAEPERLEVQVLTHWELDAKDPERRRGEQAELDAYFTELVRAIRIKWIDDNGMSPLTEDRLKDRQYWLDVYRQAQASGNIRTYLARLEIPRSSFYDAIKAHGLSGVSRKAGHNSDTEPDT